MTSEESCPGCGSEDMKYPALSRWDNKRNVCSICGQLEAGIALMVLGIEHFPEAVKEMKFARTAQASHSPVIQEKAWESWCKALHIMAHDEDWIEYKRVERETFAKMREEMDA